MGSPTETGLVSLLCTCCLVSVRMEGQTLTLIILILQMCLRAGFFSVINFQACPQCLCKDSLLFPNLISSRLNVKCRQCAGCGGQKLLACLRHCYARSFHLQTSRNVCPDATARPWQPRMGLDDSELVRPDTVSPTLRCPICTDVLLEARSHVPLLRARSSKLTL